MVLLPKKANLILGYINRSVVYKIWEVIIPLYSAREASAAVPFPVLCTMLLRKM